MGGWKKKELLCRYFGEPNPWENQIVEEWVQEIKAYGAWVRKQLWICTIP